MEEQGDSGVPRRPVAVLNGASDGVGRATATLLATRGYEVAVLGGDEVGLRAVADDVLANGARAVAVCVDVANGEEVRRAGREVETRLGPVDVWINNRELTTCRSAAELSAEDIRRATENTYLAQAHGAVAALALMSSRDAGTIVSVSSMLAYRSIPMESANCGGEAGARAFMDSLRTELLRDHSRIRVSQVVLPAVNTIPSRAAARAIVHAAHSAPRRYVVGIRNRMILMLDRMAPGVLDHVTARGHLTGQLARELPSATADRLREIVRLP